MAAVILVRRGDDILSRGKLKQANDPKANHRPSSEQRDSAYMHYKCKDIENIGFWMNPHDPTIEIEFFLGPELVPYKNNGPRPIPYFPSFPGASAGIAMANTPVFQGHNLRQGEQLQNAAKLWPTFYFRLCRTR